MSSAFDPRQPNRTRQPAPRPVSSGQRPMQPTQRAAQPAARSAQPLLAPLSPLSVQASSLFVVLLSSLLPIQPSPRAVPALSSRLLPSVRRDRHRNHAPTHIMLMARTALLRPRARAITRALAVVPKRKAPRCL